MAYKTKNGRRLKLTKNATNGRQVLVKLEGTVATFECAAGHQQRHNYGAERISEEFLQKMSSYWGLGLQSNGTKGFVYGWCQKCQNENDGVQP